MKNTLLVLALLFQGVSVASAQTPEAVTEQAPDAFKVGSSTRTWLQEQVSETNRAPTEPYPAQRAAQSAARYINGADAANPSAANNSFKASSNATGSSR